MRWMTLIYVSPKCIRPHSVVVWVPESMSRSTLRNDVKKGKTYFERIAVFIFSNWIKIVHKIRIFMAKQNMCSQLLGASTIRKCFSSIFVNFQLGRIYMNVSMLAHTFELFETFSRFTDCHLHFPVWMWLVSTVICVRKIKMIWNQIWSWFVSNTYAHTGTNTWPDINNDFEFECKI